MIQQTSSSVGVRSEASAAGLAPSPSERRSDTHARKHVRVTASRLRATARLHRPVRVLLRLPGVKEPRFGRTVCGPHTPPRHHIGSTVDRDTLFVAGV